MHTCEVCDAELTKKPGPGRWPKRCAGCPRRDPKPRRQVSCEACGTEFRTHYGIYCSGACRARSSRLCDPDYLEKNRARQLAAYCPSSFVAFTECRFCATLFCARSSRASVCPLIRCQRRHNAERAGRYGHARRAKIRGADSEIFDRAEIFLRDGWACGICELPVDPALTWPDPGSATLDHIIPIAKGGAHTRANTQCAHFYCNNVKGARLTA